MICNNLVFVFFLAIVDHGAADAPSIRGPAGNGNGGEGTSLSKTAPASFSSAMDGHLSGKLEWTRGVGACDGLEACQSTEGNVGKTSCVGERACLKLDGDVGNVGNDSCHGKAACYHTNGNVKDSSCNGYVPCHGMVGNVGSNSCEGDHACRNMHGNVARGSCIGTKACYGTKAMVGSNSCTSAGGCADYEGFIPHNCPSKHDKEAGLCKSRFDLVDGATCPDNYKPLTSAQDCYDAGVYIGYSGKALAKVEIGNVERVYKTDRPEGCYQRTVNDPPNFYFNEQPGGGHTNSGNEKMLCESILSPEFVEQLGGICKASYKPLTSSWEECRVAAVSLGYSGSDLEAVSTYENTSDKPQGCYIGYHSVENTGIFKTKVKFNSGPGRVSRTYDRRICTANY